MVPRVRDDGVMRLLRLILKASGKQGVRQGGVISALLSNIYLTEVDRMLERAKTVTTRLGYTAVEYARFTTSCADRFGRYPHTPSRCRQASDAHGSLGTVRHHCRNTRRALAH